MSISIRRVCSQSNLAGYGPWFSPRPEQHFAPGIPHAHADNGSPVGVLVLQWVGPTSDLAILRRSPRLSPRRLNPASPQQRDYWFSKDSSLRCFETLPEPPGDLVPTLFDLTLSIPSRDRAGAQRVLNKYPGENAEIHTSTGQRQGGRQGPRPASCWQRIEAPEGIAPCKMPSKDDTMVHGAMMSALESFGGARWSIP